MGTQGSEVARLGPGCRSRSFAGKANWSPNDHAILARGPFPVHNADMTTGEHRDGVPGQLPVWDAGSLDATERELRAKARALRALAQSALATGTADETVREYLNAVMAFAGMHVGD